MQINLNDPSQVTEDNVRKLLASANDSTDTQLRVTKDGIAYLSKIVDEQDTENLAFRVELWVAGNGFVGPEAAADSIWVQEVFRCLQNNWPKPSSSIIDNW